MMFMNTLKFPKNKIILNPNPNSIGKSMKRNNIDSPQGMVRFRLGESSFLTAERKQLSSIIAKK